MDALDNDKSGSSAAPKATSTIAAAICWWIALFLLLVALTVESLSSAPGRLRLIVVGLAAGALGVGFFLAYARRPATRSFVGLRRFNAVMLWLVALGIAAYALVPRGGATTGAVAPSDPVTVKPGVDEAQLAAASKRTFVVRGMVCQSCVETVTEALLGVPGVLAADVELEGGWAVVSSAPDAIPPDTALVNAVVAAGYKAWPRAHDESDGTEQTKVSDD
jgi:copper chaperone CopZ